MINKERGIRAGVAKAELMKKRRIALIPSTRSLLESVKGPREQADVVGMCWINEPRGLLAEDLLLEVTMKKGVGDVHLVHRPGTGNRKVENRAYRTGLDHRSKGVGEVDAGSLPEATNNPACFVAVESTIGRSLCLKTHLPVMTLACRGRGTSCHVWLRSRASNSSCIEAIQSGSRRAARTEDGSGEGDEVDAAWTYSSGS